MAALRRSITGEPATGLPRKHWRWVLAGLAYTAFMIPVGVFSVWPRFGLIETGHSMVSVSFSLAGDRIGECRRLSQEELDELPPNMRNPVDCPRERLPVRVLLTADGQILYDSILPPAGFWNDGAASVYRRIPVTAGRQELFIGANARGETAGFDYSLVEQVDLNPGQHVVIEFDHIGKTFFLRME